jgi:hypothetical protein
LAQAQTLCEEILGIQPRHFDALLLLGIIAGQTKNFAMAAQWLASYTEANAMKTDFAGAYSKRGNVQRARAIECGPGQLRPSCRDQGRLCRGLLESRRHAARSQSPRRSARQLRAWLWNSAQ